MSEIDPTGDLGREIDEKSRQAAAQAIERMASLRLDQEHVDFLRRHLASGLDACPDPTRALRSLERFLAASRNIAGFFALLRRRPRALASLLQLFGTSEYLSDLLIGDPDLVDWLIAGPDRLDRSALFELLWSEVLAQPDEAARAAVIRSFRHREMLRISYNDIVRDTPLEVVTQDLSHLADACVEAAVRLARAQLASRHGEPRSSEGRPLRFVVLALGKLGGEELNYSSDIDLIFLYESEGATSGPRPVTNAEFFSRVGSEIIRLLSEHTARGAAYRVDMRLRPEGQQGPLARSVESALGYYETQGRTWERQALIKARPAAGDLSLGADFLELLSPFIYRRHLSAAEILEIKALKRRIESRTTSAGDERFDVKTGHGGIRDVEYTIQFLQLLHGGAAHRLRRQNSLQALGALEQVGCITAEERAVMDETYRFLRRIEHRLQILYYRQTHTLPRTAEAQRALALRLGYRKLSAWEHHDGPAERFLSDYRSKTDRNRRILNHLLHDAFDDEAADELDAVVNLVLDPEPTDDMIRHALAPYPFRFPAAAYRNLMALARENIEFLSQPRCRHFLAAIAPHLLRALAKTSDPDRTLTNLERVSASLGAKAMLWELFSMNPPSLRLYVELCAKSQFLSEILINNPGMIDDLIDSLVFDRPAPAAVIAEELAELCKRAEDLGQILQGFRNKEWLRIGTRDILAREPIRKVTRELSDVAEAVVSQAAHALLTRQVERVGTPTLPDGQPAGWAIVALGKLGGRAMTYHSDLDLIFIFEEDGQVAHTHPPISNARFFISVTQQILRELAGTGGAHALYHVDTRLRPHGSSGELAVALPAFVDYFQTRARPWERLALARSRVIHHTEGFGQRVADAIRSILLAPIDAGAFAGDLLANRRLRLGAHPSDHLKLGPGGMSDVEFLVQFLQLRHAPEDPRLLKANTWEALAGLRRAGLISKPEYRTLRNAYNFYRTVESRVRIFHNQSEATLPADLDRLMPDSSETPLDLERGIAPEPSQTRLAAFRQAVFDILETRFRSHLESGDPPSDQEGTE